jgi:hypothetical protein
MRLTRKHLRHIIREGLLDECPNPGTEMPCPIETAAKMRTAGAMESDVLHWVQLLISEFSGGHEEAMPEEEISMDPMPIHDEGLMDDPISGG